MKYPWLFVGAKVARRSTATFEGYLGLPPIEITPDFNVVYTVREITTDIRGFMGIRLVEIVNKPMLYIDGLMEASFAVDCFQPVLPDTKDLVAEMNRKMIDHVNGASGGRGVGKKVLV